MNENRNGNQRFHLKGADDPVILYTLRKADLASQAYHMVQAV